MKELKRLYNLYKIATEAADLADKAWEKDPENEELEKAFDDFYKEQHEASEALTEAIEAFTKGQVSKKTARTILVMNPKKFDELMNKIA